MGNRAIKTFFKNFRTDIIVNLVIFPLLIFGLFFILYMAFPDSIEYEIKTMHIGSLELSVAIAGLSPIKSPQATEKAAVRPPNCVHFAVAKRLILC